MEGNYLTTIGSDNKMKVFDIRKTFNELYSYSFSREPTSLDVSQNGLVGVSFYETLIFWKDLFKSKQSKPYFKHVNNSRNNITDCKFCPYEEFMGIAYNNKFENIFVPGSGSQSYDTYEANVAGIKKQVRENMVHQIIEKVI